MKLFGIIEIGESKDTDFLITDELLSKNNNDIWNIVNQTEQIQKNLRIPGIYYVRVKGKPDRISVNHDKKISEDVIKKILVDQNIL